MPYQDIDWRFGRVEVAPREDWLRLAESEEVLEPQLPIVDAHHHLWMHDNHTYLLPEFLKDAGSGHNVLATVFLQCDQMYRDSGPDKFRPVGEIEFVNGVAAMSASGRFGQTRVASGIVGKADLSLGEGIRPVLEEMVERAGPRFVGIRTQNNFHPDPVIGNANRRSAELLEDAGFHQGLRELAKLDRAFDVWVFHTQLADVLRLARSLPEVRFVIGHCGGPLGYGPFAARHDEVFQAWKQDMAALAKCPNVWVKLGGIINRLATFDFFNAERPASSILLAQHWERWIMTTIELFGPSRCMFESNFPVDKYGVTYSTLWNTFKRLTATMSDAEKTDLFSKTATDFYRLKY